MSILVVGSAGAGGVLTTGDDGGPVPALKRPNIVVILTDDQSFESVAAMPYLSQQKDWVVFDRAYVNVALCCPSRATVLSGQYSHHTGVEANRDGPRFREADTVATWLQAGGYTTGMIGKYLNGYPWGRGSYVPPGWDRWHVFVKVGYYDYTLNQNGIVSSHGSRPADYSTDVLARKATKFISAQSSPFFLMVAPNAPHSERIPAPRHRSAPVALPSPVSLNEGDVSDKPAWVRGIALRDIDKMNEERRRQYRTNLAIDDLVRKVTNSLRAKGVLDETVILFTTDNGFSFGEHRHFRKICPYEECMRVPMLARHPGAKGRHVDELVQNVDLATTIADLAGVKPSIVQDGRSLAPLLRDAGGPWRDQLLMRWAGGSSDDFDEAGPDSIPSFWAIRTDRYKYVELSTGERELYDLDQEPGEIQNLAGDRSLSELQSQLATRLGRLRPAE